VTRSQRMLPVQKLAEERANAAAKAYAEARDRSAAQRQRLEQLAAFREDYLNQRTASGSAGMDGFRLRDYNAFLARIDAAIRHQQEVIRQVEADTERLRLVWMEQLGRARAMDKVVERYRQEEQRADERRGQRQTDELALRRRGPDLE